MAYILIIAFILRLIFLQKADPVSDELDYLGLSKGILKGRYIIPGTKLHTFRTPGYPFFLALFGFAPRLIQAIIGTGTVYMTYLIALHLFGEFTAIIAALLMAVEYDHILSTRKLLPDTLFVFITMLGVYFMACGHYLMASLILGMSAIIKPVNQLIFIIPLVLGSGLHTLSFMIIVPWMLMNYIKYGVFSLSSISGYNLYFYNVGLSILRSTDMTIDQVNSLTEKTPRKFQDFKMSGQQKKKAITWIRKNPVNYFMGQVKGLYFLFFDASKIYIPILLICYITAVYGVLIDFELLPILVIGYYLLFTGAPGRARYRLSLSPYYIMFSATGLISLLKI